MLKDFLNVDEQKSDLQFKEHKKNFLQREIEAKNSKFHWKI